MTRDIPSCLALVDLHHTLLLFNFTSLSCSIGAILLALNGVEGWGWFLLISLFTTSYYSLNQENDSLNLPPPSTSEDEGNGGNDENLNPK